MQKKMWNVSYKINCVVILPAIKTSGKICFGIYTGIELIAYRAAESKIPFNHFGRYSHYLSIGVSILLSAIDERI